MKLAILLMAVGCLTGLTTADVLPVYVEDVSTEAAEAVTENLSKASADSPNGGVAEDTTNESVDASTTADDEIAAALDKDHDDEDADLLNDEEDIDDVDSDNQGESRNDPKAKSWVRVRLPRIRFTGRRRRRIHVHVATGIATVARYARRFARHARRYVRISLGDEKEKIRKPLPGKPLPDAASAAVLAEIERMFAIVMEVVPPTVKEFEEEYADWMGKDERTRKIVDLIVKQKVAENVTGITKQMVMEKMIARFMGHLEAELKVFSKHLKACMLKDKKVRSYAMFMIKGAPIPDSADEASEDEAEATAFINVDTIMRSMLFQLGQETRQLWRGLGKRVFMDVSKDPKTDELFKIIAKQQPGKDIKLIKHELFESSMLGFIHGAIRFNQIFAEKFKKNEKAIKVATAIVAGMMKSPKSVEFVVSRGKILKVLEGVLDKSVTEFKAGVVKFHKEDTRTNAFIQMIVKELQKHGKNVTAAQVRAHWLSKMDKLLMGGVMQLKGAVAADFFNPENKFVAMLIKALKEAKDEDKDAADSLFEDWFNDESAENKKGIKESLKKTPTKKELADFILDHLSKIVQHIFKRTGKFYIMTSLHDKYTKMYIADEIKTLTMTEGKGAKGLAWKVRAKFVEQLSKAVIYMEEAFKKLFTKNFFLDNAVQTILDDLTDGFKGLGWELPKPKPDAKPGPMPKGPFKPWPKPAGKPGPKPAGKPGPKPAGKPGPKPAGNPWPKPAEKPWPKPAGKPWPKPAGKPWPKPAGKPWPKPVGKPWPKPVGKPWPIPKGPIKPRPMQGTKPTWPKKTTKPWGDAPDNDAKHEKDEDSVSQNDEVAIEEELLSHFG